MHGHAYRKQLVVTSAVAAIADDRELAVLSRRGAPGPGEGGAGP